MNEGTIFTFYSYKGGVGRTFALANIAALLSLWGYKTLCIDWDLEAPGLHLYFKKWMSGKGHRGLTELIQAHADGKNPRWQNYVKEIHLDNAKQPLTLISAGLQDESYVQRMQALDWTELYERHDLGNFLEELRENWKESFDFVLIDSRTGITDIGGICTIQLPDLLVLLFTANDQSLHGCIDVVERARRARANMPVDRAKLLVLPVAARFEGRVEVDLAQKWLNRFADALTPFYNEWSHRDVAVADLLNHTRIPYVPYWSFGEKLPVIDKGTKDPDDIGFPLETLAAFVAQQLDYSDVLVRNRDTFVTTAKKEQIETLPDKTVRAKKKPGTPLQVLISYAHEDEKLLKELEKHLSSLKRQNIIDLRPDKNIEVGANQQKQIDLSLEKANIILLCISPDYMASDYVDSPEMQRLLERHAAGETTVIPIILRSTFWQSSPIGNLQALPGNGKPIVSTSWYNTDEAMLDVTVGLQKLIEQLPQ